MNKKGFLLVAVLFLITFILGSFLLGYKLVYSKGQKIISGIGKNVSSEKVENITTLIYNEFYKIDIGINRGNYINSLDFFCGNKSESRVWLNKTDSNTFSEGGYRIKKINYNKKVVYEAKEGSCFKVIDEKLREGNAENKFEIHMEKNIKSKVGDFRFLVKIVLEYTYKNSDITKPDMEYVKEMEVYSDG